MKNSKKLILVMVSIICIVILLVGSIAYYRIVVNGSIKGSTGNAVFVLRDSDNSVWNNKEINLGKINPGDSGEFTVTMDASGSSVDMYATLEIERTNLPTNLKFYTTSDHKSELHKYYSFLENNGTNSETLTIYWYWNPYIDDEEDSKFINVSNLEANVRVSAVQISEYAMMKNGSRTTYDEETGNEINSISAFWQDAYKPYIRTITFGNDLSNLPSSCTEENLCWDISYSTTQNKKVYGYLIDSGLKDSTDNTKSLYNLYIVSEALIFAPANCSCVFENFKNLIQIDFNNNFNTSNVADMAFMFQECSSLTNLDLSNFNTSKVTDMSNMFRNCSSLTSLDLSNFDTQKVTDMTYMFLQCSSLTSLNLSSFNTSNVTSMDGMVRDCLSLTSLDLSNFDTSKVIYIAQMFYDCSSLKKLNLSSFNTSKVTRMSSMFWGCSSLTSLKLSGFNTSKVTDMSYMFRDCSSLTNLDLSNFNTSSVTNMSWMFYGCSSLTNLDLSSFNILNVKNMERMFESCSSLVSLDLSSFDTSNVANMSYMFLSCSKLTTTINIMNASTTSYSSMFVYAATDSNALITVNYIEATSTLVDRMIATKTYNSNIVKGDIIPEYSITINGNDDITYECINRIKGTKVTLKSISGNNRVTSFKMNGTTISGNEFTMPGNNVTITDIVAVEVTIVETDHNPYPNSQSNVVLIEKTFEGAKSLTVTLDYQTEGARWDYFIIYDSSTATSGINNNKKYGGKTRTTETITINSNYIKITFKSDGSGNNYYGLKATIIPNY